MTSLALHDDRSQLLNLLCERGIRRSTPDKPLCFPDGKEARWMLDSLRVSLTAQGAQLAGRCLWAILQRYSARQVATYGTTAIPLLQACILQSGGALRGLIIRKDKKRASGQIIEGDLDPSQPVVMLDDSIHSGQELAMGMQILQQAGAWVEGGVVLVRFGWGGGFARLQDRGLRMESLFDAITDLSPLIDGPSAALVKNGSKNFPDLVWAEAAFPDGMHPATLAREVIDRTLASQPIPRPPRSLDRSYDGSGGVWVSIRPRSHILLRHARDGFWHLPDESPGPLPLELIQVAARTARRLQDHGDAVKRWQGSAVAVTFFGRLQACTPGQIDNDRFGILVKSQVRPLHWGGALPRMPGMSREWAQLEHARKNARLLPHEPHDLYRHTVEKIVEPDATWQPTGTATWQHRGEATPWYADLDRGGLVAQRTLDLLLSQVGARRESQPALSTDLLPALDSLFVTIFCRGQVVGCMGGRVNRLDEDLRKAVQQALQDRRFVTGSTENGASSADADAWAVMVSLLHDPMQLGIQTPDEIAVRVRLGQQALLVFQDRGAGQARRQALLLPFAALQHSLSRPQYVAELIDKAGITRPPYAWVGYDCDSWLATGSTLQHLPMGLPSPATMPPTAPVAVLQHAITNMVPLLASYLLRWQKPQGGRIGIYRPLLAQTVDDLALPRQVHGSWIMARLAALSAHSDQIAALQIDCAWLTGLAKPDAQGDVWLEAQPASTASAAFLLILLCEQGDAAQQPLIDALDAMLFRRIAAHGRLATHPTSTPDSEVEGQQDYLPAQALLALSRATQWRSAMAGQGGASGDALLQPDRWAVIRASLRFYANRFLVLRGWGHVTWLTQAASAWWQITRCPDLAELTFSIVDWALDFQQEKSGGFINGEQPDAPGCMTAVVLEGLVAGLSLAVQIGDRQRSQRYLHACAQALRFLDGLIYQERDRPLLPQPDRAIGGLRMSHTASDVRIDFVQHLLSALLDLRELFPRLPNDITDGQGAS